jgi:pilus assembly protein Flp/PilA
MDRTPTRIKDRLREEAGVTAIEYSLLAGLIAVVIVGAVGATGTSMEAIYTAWSVAVLQALAGVR